MRTLMTLAVLLASISPALAQARSPYLEDHTWPELEALMAAGTTTAVVMAGGIEQNGPHMAFVKHNLIARHISGQVAQRLGNALAYPVIPFSMAGDPIEKNNHMRLPGTISLPVFLCLCWRVHMARSFDPPCEPNVLNGRLSSKPASSHPFSINLPA